MTAFSATGGVKTTDGAYTVHVFTVGSGIELVCTGDPSYAEVLLVTGGGCGSIGGGGGGGVISKRVTLAGTIALHVGEGGQWHSGVGPDNGDNTTFGDLVASGGGRGSAFNERGADGGSGGGSGPAPTADLAGGSSVSLQGQTGGGTKHADYAFPYVGAGGGGFHEIGEDPADASHAGNGGEGLSSDIVQRGVMVGYAGGGGGGVYNPASGYAGLGTHGGGRGDGVWGGAGTIGTDGVDDTGGGGGGGYGTSHRSGGRGIIVIRYLTGGESTLVWTDSSLTINDDAATTDDNDVVLTISAIDQLGFPPDEMRLAEDDAAALPGDVTWGAWEPYATTRDWQLAAVADAAAHPRGIGVEFRVT